VKGILKAPSSFENGENRKVNFGLGTKKPKQEKPPSRKFTE